MTETTFYRIVPHPGAHLFAIDCTVSAPDPDGQRFVLPAWIPGSYLIREFARNVVRASATCDGVSVPIEKIDKHTWRCAPCAGPLNVSYEVYAWDLSVRGAHLDTTHGYFNGTSVFLLPLGKENLPCTVDIQRPAGPGYADWRVATAMQRGDAKPFGFGRYSAADYQELIDQPVEIGSFTLAHFTACGVPHDLAITGRHRADIERLCRDLKTICEHHIRFFGEPAPMSRYLFLLTAVGEGYGGLEHANSTSLLCSREDLPRPGQEETGEHYRTFLGLASHEYFHAWNVKRIKPAVFVPYDLTREGYTRQLWAFEGVTSYYDDLALVRAGLIKVEDYLELLGQTVTRVLRGSGRLKQSVADSSFDAWIKFYRQDENAPNAIVSYYAKGALIALALDLTIRLRTDGARSLDDVMRALWGRFGKTGVGVPEGEIERVAGMVCGADLTAFFQAYLHGTEDPPLDELLPQFGIGFRLRPSESEADKGGKAAAQPEERLLRRGALGARLGEAAGGVKLAQVFDGGAAQAAGLAAGDVIVAIDGIRAGKDTAKLVGDRGPGERLRLHAFRRDELMEFEVVLQAPPRDTCVLSMNRGADARAKARGAAWLQQGIP